MMIGLPGSKHQPGISSSGQASTAGPPVFFEGYGSKYETVADGQSHDRDTLLALYNSRPSTGKHLRTISPIESTSATVCNRCPTSPAVISIWRYITRSSRTVGFGYRSVVYAGTIPSSASTGGFKVRRLSRSKMTPASAFSEADVSSAPFSAHICGWRGTLQHDRRGDKRPAPTENADFFAVANAGDRHTQNRRLLATFIWHR